jgi:integrase
MSSGIDLRVTRDGVARYRVRVRVDGRNLAGTFGTPEEALAWRAQALAFAAGRGPEPASPRPRLQNRSALPKVVSIEDAARRFIRGALEGTTTQRNGTPYKPSTVRTYEIALRVHVIPAIGRVPLATLRRGDVQRMIDEVAAAGTPRDAQKALVALRACLHVARRYDEVEGDPTIGVAVPRSAHGERPAQPLTPEAADSVLVAAGADDVTHDRSLMRPLVELTLATGLRSGELLALRWGSGGLDPDTGLVRVQASLDRERDRVSGERAFVAPKSRASRRDVTIAADVVTTMREHRLATGRPADGELVFAGSDGRALVANGVVRSSWRRITRRVLGVCATCGSRYVGWGEDDECAHALSPLPRFHDLRHTYATHALASGLREHVVAAILGHADAKLVWNRYGHALPDEVASAGERLAAWREERRSAGS